MSSNRHHLEIRAATFDAYDPVTGKKKWSYKSKYPLLASALATGGDLVFTGDPEGDFIAFDATNGDKVWTFNTVVYQYAV